MTLARRLAAGTIAATLLATPLAAEEAGFFEKAERFLRRISTQYAVIVLRTVVDITYDNLSIDPRTNDVILSGIRVYPELDWDLQNNCIVTIERIRSGDLNTLSEFRSVMQVNGVTIPGACLQPAQNALLASFGMTEVRIETMAIDAGYDLPSSGADLSITAAIAEAGDLTITADLDYLFLRFPVGGGYEPTAEDSEMGMGRGQAPTPIAWLDSIEIAFENRGLFQKVEPLLTQQMGDLAALPQMAQGGLMDMLTEGGTRVPTDAEVAFIQNVKTELDRFVKDKDRLVISADPEESVRIDAEALSSPVEVIANLAPEVAARPLALRTLVDPALVATALSGGDLTDEQRLIVGTALLTGIGAPRGVDAGVELLTPLANAGNADASLALARAKAEAGDHQAAYSHALGALAAGAEGAVGLADQIETELDLPTILAAQQQAMAGATMPDSGALVAEGGVAALRSQATALATGIGTAPRSYADAYRLAVLAAAAGDRVAAALVRRLDDGFSRLPEADRAAWAEASGAASAAALESWTKGGIGQTLSAAAPQ